MNKLKTKHHGTHFAERERERRFLPYAKAAYTFTHSHISHWYNLSDYWRISVLDISILVISALVISGTCPTISGLVIKKQLSNYPMANDQLTNDQYTNRLIYQYTNDQYTNIPIHQLTNKKREHTKYKLKRRFKLQFW